jgi:ribosome-associated protein
VKITDTLSLDDNDLEISFSRSGGSGGQNVNKVSSKVHLRLKLAQCSLDEAVKMRLRTQNPSKVTEAGDFLVTSEKTRDQHQNVEDAKEKLAQMIRAALYPPKPRKKTKRTKGSERRRLEGKKHHSEKKRMRTSLD